MKLTETDLRNLFPFAKEKNIYKFIEPLNETLEKYEINSILRVAAFCAQIEVESGSLNYLEEIADGSAYEYRKDLGNLDREALDAAHKAGTTTGKFYKGHGLIQITGFYNHKKVGEALKIDCVNNPTILCEPLYACLSAGWYWDARNCNQYADEKNLGKITKLINGGTNGAVERAKAYARNLKYLESRGN